MRFPRLSMRPVRVVFGLFAGFLLAQTPVWGAESPLFADGKTVWRICIAEASEPEVLYAVEELTNALKKISSVDFPVQIGGDVPTQHAIVIGDLTHPLVQQNMQALKLAPGEVEQSAVKTIGGQLFLAGNQPRGALYAVYTFLNKELGVRWLWPGESGEFMPARAEYSLEKIDITHTPGYQYRGFHTCGAWRDRDEFLIWMGRNFVNMHRHVGKVAEKRLGFHSIFSDHNVRLNPDTYFAEHPEYFSELEGKRYPGMICMTHPDVLKLVAENLIQYVHRHPELEILSLFPSDSNGDCRCKECAKMSVSTAWFSFYNKLTDILKAEFPKLKFATLAYMGYLDVPDCELRNTEFVEYATYGRCNVHPFSHTNCTRNARVLKGFDDWEKTGLPIGNYGYEFDVFRANARFTPFFTMIEDAVREGYRRQQVALITEVVLSPATGPVTSVQTVQNRLPIYLYAQFMWNPALTTDELLADWCQTVYGDAAEPMLAYFRAMGEAWTNMDRHLGILGDAILTVDFFMTEELQANVQRAFDLAKTALVAQAPSAARERALEAFERELVLYKQWQDLLALKSGGVPRVDAPLLEAWENFTDDVSLPVLLPGDDAASGTEVRVAWTEEALFLRWRCGEPQPAQLRALADVRDGNVADDDAVEVEISSGATGESFFFSVNTKGIQADARLSTVGVMEPNWNATWQSHVTVGARHWDAFLKIPFAAIGEAPQPEAIWQLRLRRTSGGRVGRSASVFPEAMPAMLFFNQSPATGRQLLYWSTEHPGILKREAIVRQGFMRTGWDMHFVATPEALMAVHPTADAFWFRYPTAPNPVPTDYWSNDLLPAVSNGAVAVFSSYAHIPLEQYFNDPSFKVIASGIGGLPLSGRRTTFVAPGEWGEKPFAIAKRLMRGYAPQYGFTPADPDAWTVLTLANTGEGKEPIPYLLVRRYGRGLVVRGGEATAAQQHQILANLVRWNTRMRETLPDGELKIDLTD